MRKLRLKKFRLRYSDDENPSLQAKPFELNKPLCFKTVNTLGTVNNYLWIYNNVKP